MQYSVAYSSFCFLLPLKTLFEVAYSSHKLLTWKCLSTLLGMSHTSPQSSALSRNVMFSFSSLLTPLTKGSNYSYCKRAWFAFDMSRLIQDQETASNRPYKKRRKPSCLLWLWVTISGWLKSRSIDIILEKSKGRLYCLEKPYTTDVTLQILEEINTCWNTLCSKWIKIICFFLKHTCKGNASAFVYLQKSLWKTFYRWANLQKKKKSQITKKKKLPKKKNPFRNALKVYKSHLYFRHK